MLLPLDDVAAAAQVFDPDADRRRRLRPVHQQAGPHHDEVLAGLDQPVLHGLLVGVRHPQHAPVHDAHDERQVPARLGDARGAQGHDPGFLGLVPGISSGAGQGREQRLHAALAHVRVVDGQPAGDEGAADGEDDAVDEPGRVRGGGQAPPDGGGVVRVALDDGEVGVLRGRELVRQLGRRSAERDARVALCQGVSQGREAAASGGAEKGDGLGVVWHGLVLGIIVMQEVLNSVEAVVVLC